MTAFAKTRRATGRRWASGLATALALALVPLASGSAQELSGALLADGTRVPAGSLAAGQQQLLENASGPLAFAGRQLTLDGFTGVLGFSAETAYVAVIAGSVSMGEDAARPGQLLILPPLGAAADIARFDAERLAQSWQADFAGQHSAAFDRLRAIARRQQTGVFLGRLGTTSLNLAAPAGARAEAARRSVVGEQAVLEVRYGGAQDFAALGRSVSERMLAALTMSDDASVAALLDPVPYGNTDLTGGGGDARRLTARSLIARHDWPRLLSGAVLEPLADGQGWVARSAAGSTTVNLRRMGDFVFVSSIVGGEVR